MKMEGYSNFLQQFDRPNDLVQQSSFTIELLEHFKLNNKSNLDKDKLMLERIPIKYKMYLLVFVNQSIDIFHSEEDKNKF
jgi:hypothetical protein